MGRRARRMIFSTSLVLLTVLHAQEGEVRYLLRFRALPPHEKRERNLYEFARTITGFIDGKSFPPSGVITDSNVRYGVTSAHRVRVVRKTDSRTSPSSSRDSVYILVYNPIYKLCAKSYSIDTRINYVDCEDQRQLQFPLTSRGRFDIYEVEVATGNILRDVWQKTTKGD
jgi:hypothetical protein